MHVMTRSISPVGSRASYAAERWTTGPAMRYEVELAVTEYDVVIVEADSPLEARMLVLKGEGTPSTTSYTEGVTHEVRLLDER